MNATIGLLAYGLRPTPLAEEAPGWLLAAGSYGSMSWDLQMAAAHAGCHISAFCRNPLHPGPCKGWKHHLGLVSPGALHALEKIRHEKLESNRQSKVQALKDAGKAIPKHLATPIVYDPTKNKHIAQPDKITPGLGIPTKGLTPEAAQETLKKIPTKAQVGAKLDAKHAADAAAEAKKINVGDAVQHKGSWNQHIVVSHNADGTSNLEQAGTPGKGKTKVHTADLVKLTGKEADDAHAAHALAKAAGTPTMLTISKAGLKDGDQVFLHGHGAGGAPQLVTVQKKPKGYQFVDDQGNVVHGGGGASAKWALSPAPGKSFPATPAQKVAANLAGFEKGEQTKMDNLHKLGEAQKKANGQIDALIKVHAMAAGHHVPDKQKAAMYAKAAENAQLDTPKKILPEGAHETSAKKIAAKLWAMKGSEAGNLMHQGDLEKALAQDIHDGVDDGHATPVLDAARDAAVTLGQDKPGAMQALADAVHAKLGISGKDDTPAPKPSTAPQVTVMHEPANPAVAQHEAALSAIDVGHSDLGDHLFAVDEIKPDEYQQLNPKSQQKVKDILDHLEGLGSSKPGLSKNAAQIKDQLGIQHNHVGQAQSDAFHDPDPDPFGNTQAAYEASKAPAFGSPNAGAAPHVQTAIAYANGSQAANDTKKLAAYAKLTPAETAALDPNTKKLMEANLNGMGWKFLDPKKKAAVLDVLDKVQVAQGGGAGAGGSSAVHTPTAAVISAEHAYKGSKGAMGAYAHGLVKTGPGTSGYEAMAQTLIGMHASPDQVAVDQVFTSMAEGHAKKMMTDAGIPYSVGVGQAAFPHLVAELKDDFKGGSADSPIADAVANSTATGDIDPFIHAVMAHPDLGPDALGVKSATALDPAEVAHDLAAHASGTGGAALHADEAGKYHDLVSVMGKDATHGSLGSYYGTLKVNSTLDSLNVGPAGQSKIKSELASELAWMGDEYKVALDEGNPFVSGLAGKIDGITAHVNEVGNKLAKDNGWPEDGAATQSFKSALFVSEVKAALASNPGAGGGSTHASPASVAPPSAPNVTPAANYTAAPALVVNKTAKGTILLKHAQALKVVSLMKSFPEGQYLESPEPKIWDNLVAISAHEGVTPMQALTTLDDQNAKKLGVTNTNLLEKKVRAWLATGDGKTYADANSTPKAILLDHIKKKDSGQSAFTNTTGIDLPPGEKVQKLGGPGEHDENMPSSAFGKHDVATAEKDQNKLKSELGVKFTPQQLGALTEYVNGSGSINGWLRDDSTPSQKSIDNAIYLQSMMLPTPRDHLLLRGTGWTQFPPEARSFEGLQKLVGETLEEPAFLSASVSKSSSGFGGAVKMHIEAPKGTMGVFTKDNQYHSQFLGSEAELLLAAKTELKVLKVWKEGSQVQVLMRVVS